MAAYVSRTRYVDRAAACRGRAGRVSGDRQPGCAGASTRPGEGRHAARWPSSSQMLSSCAHKRSPKRGSRRQGCSPPPGEGWCWRAADRWRSPGSSDGLASSQRRAAPDEGAGSHRGWLSAGRAAGRKVNWPRAGQGQGRWRRDADSTDIRPFPQATPPLFEPVVALLVQSAARSQSSLISPGSWPQRRSSLIADPDWAHSPPRPRRARTRFSLLSSIIPFLRHTCDTSPARPHHPPDHPDAPPQPFSAHRGGEQ
jgi:hypothetical protein